jgi:hypothetical protein
VNGVFLETLSGPVAVNTNSRCVVVNAHCLDSVAIWFGLTSFSLRQLL